MAESRRLAALIITLAIVASAIMIEADIGGRNHIDRVIFTSSVRGGCDFCHPKIATEGVWAVVTGGCFENYRCINCHGIVSRTVPHYREVASGPHASIGCLYCHHVYHDGHEEFSSPGARTYGCREHNIAQVKWDPVAPTRTVAFIATYFVSETATKSSDIARRDFYYSTRLYGTLAVYVMNFVNPYLGRAGTYGSANRNLTCLHCHFTNVGPAAWGTTTSYIYRHPGECAQCHSRLVTATGGFPSAGSAKAHTVDPASRAPEIYCGRCHAIASYVAQSVHARIGCRCHGILHISRYNSTASWILGFAPPPGVYATYKVDGLDWSSWKLRLRYTPANNSALCIWFRVEPPEERYYPDIYGGTTPCVPVYAISVAGVLRYAGVAYAQRDGWVLANTTAYLFPGARWLICYNCHLVALPGGGIAGRLDGIPIVLNSLTVDPHFVTEDVARGLPRTLGYGRDSSAKPLALDASIASVLATLSASIALTLLAIRRLGGRR